MKWIVLLLAVILFFSQGLAKEASVEEIVADLSLRTEEINQLLDRIEVPNTLKQWFGNETANVFIAMEDGRMEIVGIKTVNGKIAGIVYGGYERPTLHVFVSEETLRGIYYAKSPARAAINALQRGKISYRGVGFWNYIKFSFIGIFHSMLRFLSNTTVQ